VVLGAVPGERDHDEVILDGNRLEPVRGHSGSGCGRLRIEEERDLSGSIVLEE
jgi:hypothetical protein